MLLIEIIRNKAKLVSKVHLNDSIKYFKLKSFKYFLRKN